MITLIYKTKERAILYNRTLIWKSTEWGEWPLDIPRGRRLGWGPHLTPCLQISCTGPLVMLYVWFIVFERAYLYFDISRITSNLPTNFHYFSPLCSHKFPSYHSSLQYHRKDNRWSSACSCSWEENNYHLSGSSSPLCYQMTRLLISSFILCNVMFLELFILL